MCRAVDYISAMSRTLSMCILNPLLKLLWLLSFVFCTSSLIDFKPSARIAMNITGFRFSEQIKSAPAQWRLAWQLSEWAMWKCVFMVIVNNLVTLFSCFDDFIICNSNGFFSFLSRCMFSWRGGVRVDGLACIHHLIHFGRLDFVTHIIFVGPLHNGF